MAIENEPVHIPSELVEKIGESLESANAPQWLVDLVVDLVEGWESGVCVDKKTDSPLVKWYRPEEVSEGIFCDMWWHDDGEQVYPVNLGCDPTTGKFFATSGQWGWNRSRDLSEMGGLWTPCVAPERNPGGAGG